MQSIKKILKDSSLRFTKPRQDILLLFLEYDYALSHADIEEKVHSTIDRVTIYRTLNAFLEGGLIHKVLDFNGSMRYALCKDECSSNGHTHEHVHFRCNNCGKTNCLDNVKVPTVSLPDGFKFIEANFLIQGICKACNVSSWCLRHDKLPTGDLTRQSTITAESIFFAMWLWGQKI